MKQKRSTIGVTIALLFIFLGASQAQEPPSACPTLVQEAFTATELICEAAGPGQACLGNGVVEAAARDGVESFTFAQPGDLATTTDFQSLRLRSTDTENRIWTVVQYQLPIASGDLAITALVFGDVALSNSADAGASDIPTLFGTVTASGGINVRRTPDTNGVIVWQLTNNETVLVTGRTADNAWYRIEIPSAFGGPGWVAAQWLRLNGDASALRIATAESPAPDIRPPEFGSMQSFLFESRPIADDCQDTPDSGIVLQTPNGLANDARLAVNGATLEFNGTVFLRAQADAQLLVSVLEGVAEISAASATQVLPAGAEASVPLDEEGLASGAPSAAQPYRLEDLLDIPVRLLPRNFVIAEPSTTSPAASPAQGDQTTTVRCVLTPTDADKNLRAGPGVDYPQVGILRLGERISAVGQITDPFQYIWYVTADDEWVRFDVVVAEGDCAALPKVSAPPLVTATPNPATTPAPSNAKSLVISNLGDLCATGPATLSRQSDGTDFSIAIGDIWTATVGTTISITTGGGNLRGEFGDFIRIVDAASGDILARSGSERTLSYTFTENRSFLVRFSANKDDTVVMTATCN